MHRVMFLICSCLLILGCSGDHSNQFILFDFESDADLNRVRWECHTLYHISEKHATHGDKSLHLELYPADYPGFKPFLEKRNWHEFIAVCFDVYNPIEKEINITVRIDDRKDDPDYADRCNHSFTIMPKMNQIRIPLDSMITSGTHRKLNLRSIHKFLIFMVNPAQQVDLYIDYVRLIS